MSIPDVIGACVVGLIALTGGVLTDVRLMCKLLAYIEAKRGKPFNSFFVRY